MPCATGNSMGEQTTNENEALAYLTSINDHSSSLLRKADSHRCRGWWSLEQRRQVIDPLQQHQQQHRRANNTRSRALVDLARHHSSYEADSAGRRAVVTKTTATSRSRIAATTAWASRPYDCEALAYLTSNHTPCERPKVIDVERSGH